MNRVCVVGGPGAGKSTLARALAAKTELPLCHLDKEYWLPRWTERPQDEWRMLHARLIKRPRWILDGIYFSTLEARLAVADTVVFLDFARWRCLAGAAKRIISNYGRVRPDMAEGCPEQVDWEFLQYLWHFRREFRPRLLAALAHQGAHCRIVHLTTSRQVRRFLRDHEASAETTVFAEGDSLR